MSSRMYKIMAVAAMVIAVVAMATALWSTVRAMEGEAAVESIFNYQGYLRNPDGSLVNGTHTITATIYDAATAGNAKYTTTIQDVVVRDGVFNIVLGDQDPISDPSTFASGPRFIGISVGGGSELIPRQRVNPVPWALQANTALTLVDNASIHGFTSDKAITVNGDATINGGATISNALNVGELKTKDQNSQNYQPIGVTFLNRVEIVNKAAGSCVSSNWETVSVASYVPVDAKGVLLDASGEIWTAAVGQIMVRQNGNTADYPFILLRGSSLSAVGTNYIFNSGIYPINPTNKSIDWRVTDSGFPGGCRISIYGYIR
jgi:hypothetical protein